MDNVNSPYDVPHRIPLACAADERFAMPLAVAVRSALENLDSRQAIDLYVLDGGLSPRSQERLLSSWDSDRLGVTWVQVNKQQISRLAVSDHVTQLTYYRLLLADVLPSSLGKVIYLDCDMLVLNDLRVLWEAPTSDKHALAVQDMAAPYIDAAAGMPLYAKCAKYLAAAAPVSNYCDLMIDPASKYFNAGVLVVDLVKWRQDALAAAFLDCLHRHASCALWWDQYALNVVLAGRWGELDPRWNLQTHLFIYPSWECSPFEETKYREVMERPHIVHFTSPDKPWHWNNTHPFREQFFKYLDMTAWTGWRPSRPKFNLRRLWKQNSRTLLLSAGRCYRGLRARLFR